MSAALVDSLVTLCMQKHAADAEFDDEMDDPSADARKRKLRTALTALGVLGAAGGAAWALSSPTVREFGSGVVKQVGDFFSPPEKQPWHSDIGAVSGATTGAGLAMLRRGIDAKLRPDVGAPVPLEKPGTLRRIADSSASRLGGLLAPGHTPASISSDITSITAKPEKAEGATGKAADFFRVKPTDLASKMLESSAAQADQMREAMKDVKGVVPPTDLKGLEHLQEQLVKLQKNPQNNVFRNVYNGVYTNFGGKTVPLEALAHLSPQQIMDHVARNPFTVVGYQNGVLNTVRVDAKAAQGLMDFHNKLGDQSGQIPKQYKPQQTWETFLSKQQNIDALARMGDNLEALHANASADPTFKIGGLSHADSLKALDNTVTAIRNDLSKRVYEGRMIVTGTQLPTNIVPKQIEFKDPSLSRQAEAFRSISQAVRSHRYGGKSSWDIAGRYARRAMAPGLVGAAGGLVVPNVWDRAASELRSTK